MVVIRFARGGAKKRPFYKIVVADKRARRDGRFIEQLGFFNPISSGKDIEMDLNVERLDHWVGQGAKLSDSVQKVVKQYRATATAVAA